MIASIASLVAILPLLASASPIDKRADGQYIHPNGDTSTCLAVHYNTNKPFNLQNGAVIEEVACAAPYYYNRWDVAKGNNANGIQLTGTSFCMDAGAQQNNLGMKVWTCYPGLAAQTWYVTDDNHIAVTGGSQCIDQENGGDRVQTYRCSGNSNQIYTIGDAPTGSPAPTDGRVLHFGGSSAGCLTVGRGSIKSGSVVDINSCVYDASQLFVFTRNQAGPVTLKSNPNLCLDAGVNPNTNGSPITVYDCLKQADGSPVPQQNWYYTDDNHLALTGLSTCLDVDRDSKPGDGYIQTTQTWQCGTDFQQVFTVMNN